MLFWVARVAVMAMVCLLMTTPSAADEEVFTRRQASIRGIVVMQTAAGYMGQTVDIIATVTPGQTDGTRFEREVGQDMQVSLDEAVRAVQVDTPAWDGGQVRVSFGDKYSAKDGGSAGTAYAVCLRSLLEGFEIDPAFALTGDITVDGKVRAIGGVIPKVRGAAADHAEIVAVPIDNAELMGDLMLLHSPEPLYQTQVFSITNVDEAVALARQTRDADLQRAIDKFDQVQKILRDRGERVLRTQDMTDMLAEVVELAPNHVSAGYLLAYARREAPTQLTLTGTIIATIERGSPAIMVMQYLQPGQATKDERDTMRTAKAQIDRLRLMAHPDAREFQSAMQRYILAGDRIVRSSRLKKRDYDKLIETADNLVAEYKKLNRDADTIEAMMRDGY